MDRTCDRVCKNSCLSEVEQDRGCTRLCIHLYSIYTYNIYIYMYICMYMCSARYVSLNVDGKQFASQKGINKSR